MKKTITWLVVFVIASLLISACSPSSQSVSIEQTAVPETNNESSAQQSTQQTQRYVEYSENAIAQATTDGGKAVLFFHAGWCPTCRAAEKDILENADKIPADLTIIKTDFDTMSELKKEYQIVTQHTFVQVDSQGNEITKWVGGDLDTILQRTEG